MKGEIITTEMRCLRQIVNVTRRDEIRNNTIKARVGVKPVLNNSHAQLGPGNPTVTRYGRMLVVNGQYTFMLRVIGKEGVVD